MVWEQCLSPAGYFQRLMKIVSCECTLWYHSCTTDNSVWPYRSVKHLEMQKVFPWLFTLDFYPRLFTPGFLCAARWGALSAKMLTVGTPAPLSVKYFGLEFILEASEQCMSPEESLLVLWHFWTCPPAAPEQHVHCTFCGTTSFSTGSKECLFVL